MTRRDCSGTPSDNEWPRRRVVSVSESHQLEILRAVNDVTEVDLELVHDSCHPGHI